MRRRGAWGILWAAWVSCLVSRAAADDSWLVTEVAIAQTSSEAARVVRDTERELRARGFSVVDAAAAVSSLERTHSRPAYVPKSREIETLEQASRRFSEAVAEGDVARVRALSAEIDEHPGDARDLLNRDVAQARRRMQSCWLAAHLLDRTGQARAAQEQISECAREFPGLPWETGTGAPEAAREFLANARRSFAAAPSSSLRIEAEPMRDKTRCFVRVNGVERGSAPISLDQLRTPRVRVQLECGDHPARIYDVPTSAAQNSLRIDPNFDAALDTQRGLALRYSDPAGADALRLKHGVVLAEIAGAKHQLQLFRGKLRLVDVASGRELASDSVAPGTPPTAAVDFVLSNAGIALPPATTRRYLPPPAADSSSREPSHGAAAAVNGEHRLARGATAADSNAARSPPGPAATETAGGRSLRAPGAVEGGAGRASDAGAGRELWRASGERAPSTARLAAEGGVTLDPAPRHEAEPPAPQSDYLPRRRPGRPFLTLGYVSAGLTVAAAATAIVFWRIREGHVNKFNKRPECTEAEPGELGAACQNELAAADTAGSVLLISAIAGGTALVLTGTFLIIDANRPRERYRDLTCGPGPGTLVVSCGMRF